MWFTDYSRSSSLVEIRYENGKILAEGGKIPYGIRDDATGDYRTPAIRYPDIVDLLKKRGVDYSDNVNKMIELCKKGPRHSQIRHVEIKPERFQDFRVFKILHI